MSKRKKSSEAPAPPRDQAHTIADEGSVTTRAVIPPELLKEAMGEGGVEHAPSESVESAEMIESAESAEVSRDEARIEETAEVDVMPESAGVLVVAEGFENESDAFDAEATVNLVGELPLPGRDDLDDPTVTAAGETLADVDGLMLQRKHLRGLLEALVFASDSPITPKELSKLASAPQKQVKELLAELKVDYATRGMHLDEVAGGWVFRTSPQYAPFVRDLTKQKPVRLTRAQVETLAIIGYRQPITRPEVDDVRGVDSGPVLKLLLERDLVRILGKRDEPGRPLIYGTTSHFLEFFGLKSLKDLPTLREFTELSDESRETFEDELGETPEDAARRAAEAEVREAGLEHGDGGERGEGDALDGGEGDADDDAGGEDAGGEDETRSVHESMRVPVAGGSSDELGEGEDDGEDDGGEDADADAHAGKHAADDDGPTLTSEAPPSEDDE